MMFWQLKRKDIPAFIQLQDQQIVTYDQLTDQVQQFVDQLLEFSKEKKFGVVYMRNSISSMVAYLGSLNKQDAVLLLDAGLDNTLKQKYIDYYKPDWVFDEQLYFLEKNNDNKYYPDLAILLSTSGSTGNPKLVRLSYNNLQSNAFAIAEYLNIDESERPITTLSPAYSYGLSVLNSHLLEGATILLTDESVIGPSFWTYFKQYKATSFAGVPYFYQMLHRLRFAQMELPSLRYFTQAGGRLSEQLISYYSDVAKEKNIPFFVMYGQTEATARISYVPPEQLDKKKGSIGIAIPSGELQIEPDTSELKYKGQNVMLGYAESREDLNLGDVQQGVLLTGDLAKQDEEGYIWITGRMKRFIKIYGLRMNLDDLEQFVEQILSISVACVGKDEQLFVITEGQLSNEMIQLIRQQLKSKYHIHHTNINIQSLPQLPRLTSGKINYIELRNEVER